NPELTKADQIIASPTLLKLSPSPPAKLIGSLSDRGRVMAALGMSELE
ncbi:MAG: circadian clock protein KaiB, partial [Planctomycetales bacterium]|nr:circadian clock protein KaiB [Planctomycetales bacterium]